MELLITIAIIAVIMGFSIVTFAGSQKRARDGIRKADLRTLQTALRLYYNDYGAYPSNESSTFQIVACGAAAPCNTACAWGQAWTCAGKTYMSKLVKDPKTDYQYTLVGATGDNYTIDACLEDLNDASSIPAGAWCPSGEMYRTQP